MRGPAGAVGRGHQGQIRERPVRALASLTLSGFHTSSASKTSANVLPPQTVLAEMLHATLASRIE